MGLSRPPTLHPPALDIPLCLCASTSFRSIFASEHHFHCGSTCASIGVFRYALCLSFSSFSALIVTLKFDASELEDVNSSSASSRYRHTGPRNSLSSISSIDADVGDSEELALIPEVDAAVENAAAAAPAVAGNEIFAVPKAKHCNSIIR